MIPRILQTKLVVRMLSRGSEHFGVRRFSVGRFGAVFLVHGLFGVGHLTVYGVFGAQTFRCKYELQLVFSNLKKKKKNIQIRYQMN